MSSALGVHRRDVYEKRIIQLGSTLLVRRLNRAVLLDLLEQLAGLLRQRFHTRRSKFLRGHHREHLGPQPSVQWLSI
jgi:hypothetical protein